MTLAVRVAAPGDRARFEKLLDRHHRRLRRFAAGIVSRPRPARRRAPGGVPQGVSQAASAVCERGARGGVALPRRLSLLPRRSAPLHGDPWRRTRPAGGRCRPPASLDRALRALGRRTAPSSTWSASSASSRGRRTILGIPRGTLSWRLSVAREAVPRAPRSRRGSTMREADLLSEAFDGQQPPERDRFFEDFWRAAEAEQRRAGAALAPRCDRLRRSRDRALPRARRSLRRHTRRLRRSTRPGRARSVRSAVARASRFTPVSTRPAKPPTSGSRPCRRLRRM